MVLEIEMVRAQTIAVELAVMIEKATVVGTVTVVGIAMVVERATMVMGRIDSVEMTVTYFHQECSPITILFTDR